MLKVMASTTLELFSIECCHLGSDATGQGIHFNKGYTISKFMIDTLKKDRFYLVVSSIVFFAFTVLLVGSFESRLANSNGDDHPVVWARFVKDVDFWKGDGNYEVGNAFSRASLPNLLASFGSSINEQIPVWLSWVYVFFQNIGIGIGLFIFCRFFVKDSKISLLVTVLCFILEPWGLNLAYYPSMMHSPYPGHLVMPLLVSAASMVLANKLGNASLLLTLAALVHPSQTLHFIALAGFYLLLSDIKKVLKKVLFFIPPVLSCLVIPYFLIPRPKNPLSDLELIPSALLNPHLVPWKTNIFWPWGVPTLIAIFSLSYLATQMKSENQKTIKNLWWANFLSFLCMGLLHGVGVRYKILPIILLCPLRITVINSVLLSPLIFIYLINEIRTKHFSSVFTAATLLTLLIFSKRGLFWGPVMILAVLQWANPKRSLARNTGICIFLWWILFLGVGRPVREIWGEEVSGFLRNFLAPGFTLTTIKITVCLILSGLLVLLRSFEKKWREYPIVLALILVIGGGMTHSYLIGKSASEGELQAMLDLQKWANKKTPRESVFLIEGSSWRGVSERRVQVVGPRKDRVLPYLRLRSPLLFERRLNQTYERLGVTQYKDLTSENIVEMVREFKGDFFVDSAANPQKSLPLKYQNEYWRVYQVGSGEKQRLTQR
ncbi:MAG: hypothetical protein FJ116_06810 [Deltaproteobacteria bacterium]|nr:hypothetical protein [Deltaproteobacteria bacterium]MBM4317174.1 hypothetical protein [Deltaproteobacteria bacterium]